mmetsp:Transcript_109096/g.213739  ORF Transcript_109096/g.213739 Transcript_109096/m.213739 type:complete len:465 (-) Transcript_109096:185-1579(-)
MIQNLFNLPEDFFRSCLIPLLSLRDIVHLDSSLLNSKLRHELKSRMGSVTADPRWAQRVSDKALKWLAQNNVKLQNISLMESVTDASVPVLSTALQYVQKLVMRHTKLSTATTISVISYCSKLQTLTLCGSLYDDNIVLSMSKGLIHLGCLSFQDNDKITDDGLVAFFPNCPQLHSLELRHCKNVTDIPIIFIAKTIPALRALRLSGLKSVTSQAALSVAEYAGNLKNFEICNCKGVSNDSVTLVAQKCPLLEAFCVTVCSPTDDSLMIILSRHCRNLLTLHLSGCETISDAAVVLLTHKSPQLKDVTLVDAILLTDIAMVSIAQSCKDLTSIFVANCTKLTDMTIIAFATFCPRLDSMYITQIEYITDSALRAIALNLSELTCLCLSPCAQVSDVGFQVLSTGECSHKLQAMFLGGCEGISIKALQSLDTGCPRLHRAFLTRATNLSATCLESLPRPSVFKLS